MQCNSNIEQLCSAVEREMQMRIVTPRDFKRLSNLIFESTREYISDTTLMRLWGYVRSESSPSKNTLNVLSRFLGYTDFAEFIDADQGSEKSSNMVVNRHLKVAKQLIAGDIVRLTWAPGRVCDVRYLGRQCFEVIAAEQTHLSKGDTFMCSLIIEGEPLYLDKLCHNGGQPATYVCGKRGGIAFKVLTNQNGEVRFP